MGDTMNVSDGIVDIMVYLLDKYEEIDPDGYAEDQELSPIDSMLKFLEGEDMSIEQIRDILTIRDGEL